MHPSHPAPQPRPYRARTAWIAVGAVLVLAVAGAITWQVVRPTPAEAAVEEFFTALLDKDMDTALALIEDDSFAHGPRREFLTPEAVADDWELTGLDSTMDGPVASYVTAEFSGPTGSSERQFNVVSTGDGWKLRDPWVEIAVDPDPVNYLQANGAVAALDAVEPRVVLLPGWYRFYQDVPGVVDTADAEPTAVFDLLGAAEVPAPAFSAAPEAEAALEAEVHERLTECANSAQGAPTDCPFGLPDGVNVYTEDGTLDEFTDAEWSIEAYPAITVDFDSTAAEVIGMQAANAESAVAVTATGYNREGVGVRFSTTCGLDLSVWPLTLEAVDGAVAFVIDDLDPVVPVTESTCATDLE